MNKYIRKPIRPVIIMALFAAGLILLGLPYVHLVDVPAILLWLGRFHPLIVHFPIVLVLLALLFEVAKRFQFTVISDRLIRILLIALVLSSWVSIGAGFFLYSSGDYAGILMDRHFWAGVILGSASIFTLAFYLLHQQSGRYYPLYFTGLLFSNVVMFFASHQGGLMTHGKEYLTEYIPLVLNSSQQEENKEEKDMLVYQDMIAPILEAKCVSCHNTQRKKGGLSLSSYQNLFTSGESSQPSILAGKPDSSLSFQRINLPMDHGDHMPPEGKTPLTEEEIHLFKYWIETGAKEETKLNEAKTDTAIGSVINQLLPELTKYRRRANLSKLNNQALQSELVELAKRLNVNIKQDSLQDGNLYTLAMKFPPAPFSNAQFLELRPYYDAFSRLSLISSGIDDNGLYYLAQMTNLRELYLQKTNIDGSGLLYLAKLPQLEVLNLSFTRLDDKLVLDLLKLPHLKEVYLYRTNTSRQVIEALRKNRPRLKIWLEEGPYF